MAILPADLAEFARPERQQRRGAGVFERRVVSALGPVVARAGEEPASQLVLAAHIRAERLGVTNRLLPPAPEQLGPHQGALVERLLQRAIAEGGVHAKQPRRGFR